MSTFFKSGMNAGLIRDPGVRATVSRLLHQRFDGADGPDAAGHVLGRVDTPDGQFRLVARHAVDLVVTNRSGRVVLIQRTFPPGAGRLALPGGFIDVGEQSRDAALREAQEETGLLAALRARLRLTTADLANSLRPVGPWRFDRPFDIRSTPWLKVPVELGKGAVLRPNDLMAVTTQAFALHIDGLRTGDVASGDDAAAVRLAEIAKLHRRHFGVRDHYDIIREAAALRRDTQK